MALGTRNPTAGDGGARNVVVHGGSTDFQNNLKARMLTEVERQRQQIEREIEMLKFKSFRIDIGRREQALRAQLQALAA